MRKYFIILSLCLLSNVAFAQMIKSFQCSKLYEADSSLIVYSVKVRFDSNTSDSSRLNLEKIELNNNHQVEIENIFSVQSSYMASVTGLSYIRLKLKI